MAAITTTSEYTFLVAPKIKFYFRQSHIGCFSGNHELRILKIFCWIFVSIINYWKSGNKSKENFSEKYVISKMLLLHQVNGFLRNFFATMKRKSSSTTPTFYSRSKIGDLGVVELDFLFIFAKKFLNNLLNEE
jgi:hypothetical protein